MIEDVDEIRDRLRERPDHEFIDHARFLELLVSRLHLQRCDDTRARTRGLVDRASGRHYVIEEERVPPYIR
jgi:hypothetical protein